MKKLWILFILIPFILNCGDQKKEGKDTLMGNIKVPVFNFEKTEHDFGETGDKEKIRYSFKFKNTGKEDLRIHNIRSTCGCAVVELEKREYKPREGGEITVIFDPIGYRGTVTRNIYIDSNDPVRPRVTLRIKAFVLIPIDMRPSIANFSNIVFNSTKEVKVSLEGVIVKKFRITNIEIPKTLDFIGSSVEELVSDRSIYHITLIAKPEKSNIGNFADNIRINTDSSEIPFITLPVRGVVMGVIRVSPERITASINANTVFSFTIALNSSEKFNITEVIIKNEEGIAFRYEIKTLTEGQNYNISLLSKQKLEKSLHGEITITTDNKLQPKFTIPLNVRVR